MTNLGLTCISEELKVKDKAKYSFRTMTRKRFNDLSEKEGRNEARKEARDGIKEGRREGTREEGNEGTEGRTEGRKEGVNA